MNLQWKTGNASSFRRFNKMYDLRRLTVDTSQKTVGVRIHTQNCRSIFFIVLTQTKKTCYGKSFLFYPLRKQWYIINDSVAIVVSHQFVRTVYHHAQRALNRFRNDDIQNFVLMICNSFRNWWYTTLRVDLSVNICYDLKYAWHHNGS